jgi:hydrogenase maturation protein HypF
MDVMANNPAIQRRRWIIRGQVQGVGFRPFIYRLAQTAAITGFVGNDSHGVIIEAQGAPAALDHVAHAIKHNAPSTAHIDNMIERTIPRIADEQAFIIRPSTHNGRPDAGVTPDLAMCADCRQELFDHMNRRFHYGLITCIQCGPRYSMIINIPYDRPATTMASFAMCLACQKEYEDPRNRRFHAQAISCRNCGPQIQLADRNGHPINANPFAQAADMLRHGAILAIKGIGGFHLAARADDQTVVLRLRRLKQRDTKPFALMCRSVSDARRFIKLSHEAQMTMESPVAPIILAMRQDEAPVAEAVAGRNCRLGVMLPYTPLQHLLLARLDQTIPALVMTSGNVTDEPLAITNAEALERLGGICDAFLWHDRPIERCVDDSVLLDMGPGQPPLPIRRSRGLVPAEITITAPADATGLCLGGELKNTIALVTGSRVILSQHLGDLNNHLAWNNFRRCSDDLCRLYQATPQFIACDMHPAYISAHYAVELARRWNARLIQVQHHHAHAAAMIAEHAIHGDVLALICDGTGLGTDGTGWGCELLLANAGDFQRLASLAPLLLPGGDMAATDIRRSGLAILYQTYGEHFIEHPAAIALYPDVTERQMLASMLMRRIQCVTSSSAGRLFDGVASLLGLCDRNHFEAEAPMAVESAACLAQAPVIPGRLWDVVHDRQGIDRLDLRPLFRHLLQQKDSDVPVEMLAAVFQSQLAAAWTEIITQAAMKHHIHTVALSGGVWANGVLANQLSHRLKDQGLTVLQHRIVPPGDGGLALGQALIAATLWNAGLAGKKTAKMECLPCA